MSEKPLTVKHIRKNFSKTQKIVKIPDLIGMQRKSFEHFLQMDVPCKERKEIGLQAVFKSVFPIKDFTGTASLEFVSYRFAEIKQSAEECIHRGMTYEIPVYITIRLVVYDIDKEREVSSIRDVKEQEVYFGTIPLMTKNGAFIINGTQRVVVSQLHRSSGVFFDHDKGKTRLGGKIVYTANIIPVRGSWIDIEIDPKDIVYVRIDRRHKFPVTILFKAFGYTSGDILAYFYKIERVIARGNSFFKEFDEDLLKGQRVSQDIKDPETGDVIAAKGRIFTKAAIKLLKSANVKMIPAGIEDIIGKIFVSTIVDPNSGSDIVKSNETVDDEALNALSDAGITEFELLFTNGMSGSDSIRKTLLLDKVKTKDEALIAIYRRLRPGSPATPEMAQNFIDNMFFKPPYYDLSCVGRLKINLRFGINTPLDLRVLRKEDVLLTVKALVKLKDAQGAVDDIDHLGNRRVRAVGELIESQYRIGLVRMERSIKERMSLQEVDTLMPHDLINSKPVSAVIKEFFGTSQLSQFTDQTNPLSETTHKRRLSALGPGGLTRERAGFEVRDVHPSHYGRICPIETPEGPNIGLIVSLSTYAQVNEHGFIETPYRVVKDATVSDTIKFLSAFEEEERAIAQANTPVDSKGRFINPFVASRVAGEFTMTKKRDIELMDVSPGQLVSTSASLIPFLENDDANRALMGSNMQRQAVPLLTSQAPLVGTGIEGAIAKDSGVVIVAQRDGTVVDVEASRIVLKHDPPSDYRLQSSEYGREEKSKIDASEQVEKPVTIYNLSKFMRTNQNTCFNHHPVVRKGQRIKAGEVIADGPATDNGELALGKNITVAFMPWGGYDFEDSILVNERLVKDGVYTSVHIEEFEVVARDTKLGKEEITRDIPNVGDEALKNLDESGIVGLGVEVCQGDILAGKITPKGETQPSPEERLFRAIFGEKAGDVKDTSLRVPPGVEGTVIDVKVFSRRGVEKDGRTCLIEDEKIAALERDRDDELSVIEDVARMQLTELLVGQTCCSFLKKGKNVLVPKGSRIDSKALADLPISQLEGIVLEDTGLTQQVDDILELYRKQCELCRVSFKQQINRYEKGDDLLPGVIKMVKICVATKRKLSVGDKMGGRHGNKGVVSRVLPQEDMPYFEDGTPVDMTLNPLGVPSRMNIGQILEIHLGLAAKGLGDQLNRLLEESSFKAVREKMKRIFSASVGQETIDGLSDKELCGLAKSCKDGVYMATPVFDGAREDEIKALLSEAGLCTSAQTTLYDGRTGEPFNEKITIGTMYMLKLHHLVDDKIHARSIGPYSLVTQQPLGGKAQFGGQRLGEMEVWALEAYGAAYTLQEFVTVKSDDMAGRTRMYEKIVKGQNVLEPGIPESFKVLAKELQSLGLDITLLEEK